ncbi:PINc/VapC family ATPase [Candidatus Woesearchaeota archaeon]|nr:PINc/VapC family ATPase [Candidatus Woesearchaeota archaeon]
METYEKLVPDTSVIIDGVLSGKIENKEIKVDELIIPEAVVAELEHQANQNKTIGFFGLEEIKKLRGLIKNTRFAGEKPKYFDVKHAGLGEIDALIRQLAFDEDAVLMTSDKVQAEVAEAKGIKLLYLRKEEKEVKIKLEGFFDENTMSVHLRDQVNPYAKKGMPGKWDFVELRKKTATKEEIQDIAREIIEEAEKRRDGFVEIERPGSTIVQLGKYRIVICRPPFADGWEITAVRPVKQLNLDDYKLSEKLMKRVAEQAEGILVAGSPGMGKTTFAQALSIFYADKNKVVKTVEAPRDLILPDKITQYAISHGDAQEIHDILLLSRPDYTIFDEMRNTDDFKLFADMRLAGVGMVGVVHATNPIDAIQRFLGRIEMGVIPQIIDTVVFIKNGAIEKVLSLNMTVKVPSGMTEADLARPVVEVHDFENDKLAYEIYSYGEQTVVVPVKEAAKGQSGVQKLAADRIKKEFMKYSNSVEVQVLSEGSVRVKVPKKDIPAIIGRQGKNIAALEDKLGVHLDIVEMDKEPAKEAEGMEIGYDYEIRKKSIVFYVEEMHVNKDVDIYVNDEFLLAARVGNKGRIKVNKLSQVGKYLVNSLNDKEKVVLLV